MADIGGLSLGNTGWKSRGEEQEIWWIRPDNYGTTLEPPTMSSDTDIEPGQLYRETDTDRAFKILEVSPQMEQAKVLYLDDVDGERYVDTRGRTEFKFFDVIRRRLAEGSLERVTRGPPGTPFE